MNLKHLIINIENPAHKRFIFIAVMRILGYSNEFTKELINSSDAVTFRLKEDV